MPLDVGAEAARRSLRKSRDDREIENRKLPWLDNTRLFAVLGVLSFHFWQFFQTSPTTLANLVTRWQDVVVLPAKLGSEADFLFFAISGLGLALSAVRRPKGWARFFLGRASKIYIPYWTALVLLFAYQGLVYTLGTWDRLFVIPKTTGIWLKNILLIPQAMDGMLSSHLWFLPSLMVMYLLFPLLFRAIDRWGVKGFAVALVLSCSARWMPWPLGPFSYAWTALVWSPSFVIGAYVGYMLGKHPEQTERWLVRTIPLGMLCLVVGTLLNVANLAGWACHPLLGFGTLSVVGAIGRLRWHLPKLTAISFEVYLIHAPFIGWYRHFFGFVSDPKPLLYAFFLITVGIMGAGVHWVVGAIDARLGAKRKPAQAVRGAPAVVTAVAEPAAP